MKSSPPSKLSLFFFSFRFPFTNVFSFPCEEEEEEKKEEEEEEGKAEEVEEVKDVEAFRFLCLRAAHT